MRFAPKELICGRINLFTSMRIGLDARSIGNKVCGVSRVASRLIRALSETDRGNEYIVYTDSVSDLNLRGNFKVQPTDCSRKNPAHDLKFYSTLRQDSPEIYHALHSWLPEFIPQKVKVVVTIHDLFSVTDPDFFIKHKPFHWLYRSYFKHLTRRAVSRADAIITVSNYCRNEIIKNFPEAEGKLNVAYNAAGIEAGDTKVHKRLFDFNYLLYVGNSRSYKNLGVLLEGFGIFLRQNMCDINKLIVAGNDDYDTAKALAGRLGINKYIVFLSNPSDEEIRSLYAHASAFIFPSKYEGFGIPVLEAMGFGVPVIISDAEALVEVARDAALVFPKHRPEELAAAIGRLLSDKSLGDEMILKGFKRVKEFNYTASAQKLTRLYQRVLTGKHGVSL